MASAAVLLFLCTFVFPFSSFNPHLFSFPEIHIIRQRVYVWSFRMSYTALRFEIFISDSFVESVEDYWFHDCWFGFIKYVVYRSLVNETSLTLIFLFAFQIATLLTAVASIFLLNKKVLPIATVVLCSITTLLTLGISLRLSQITSEFNYELGYWLTYSTEALLITNIMIKILKARLKFC